MSEKDEINYASAIRELEELLQQLETDEVDVDNLAVKVKRASHLIKICRKKLYETESDIKDILSEFDDDQQ